MNKAPKNVGSYIKGAPLKTQAKLRQLRKIIKTAAPKAEEKISYGMPYYGYKGRLAYFAYAKHHVGLYVMPPTIAQHKKELKNYKTSKATVQLPLDKPLPTALIKKLIKVGMKRNDEKNNS